MFPKFLSYFLTFLLTYIFKKPSDFGANPELFAYISFMNILFTYGMETAFFNFSSRKENKQEVYNTALISLMVSTLGLTGLLFLFSGMIGRWLEYADRMNYIYWTILIIGADAITAIPFARLRLENKAKKFAAIKALNVIINVALTIFFLVFCKNAYEAHEQSFLATLYNPEIGIGYSFLATLLANLCTMIMLYKEFMQFSWQFNKELWLEMIAYAWPLLILGFAGMINETFDRIIIKKLLPEDIGSEAQGIYGACYKIAILMTVFIQAFRYAAEPFFFKQAKEKNSTRTLAVVMKFFVIFCSFLFLGTMMNMPWIRFLVSEQYRSGLGVVPILMLANLFLGVYINLSIWFKLTGQTKIGAMITIVGAVITLIINFTFVPAYSYMACAWATLAAYGSMMLIAYFLGQKYYPVKYNLRSMFFFFLAALGFYLISLLWAGLESAFIKIILNNLFVILFAWLFYKLEFSNLKQLKNQEA
ncbi:MAG: oligosaccharide flippase family protein [Bacteroidetes bacterium]|nr:oligosaccharide flippase family protein [Bacteroidota bacterium]